MYQLNAPAFVRAVGALVGVWTCLQTMHIQHSDAESLPVDLVAVIKALKEFRDAASAMGTVGVVPPIDRLLNRLYSDKPTTAGEFRIMVGVIIPRLADDLSSHKALALSVRELEFFAPETPLFGAVVAAKFPSAGYDIEEAGKCLAVGRSTAAAFTPFAA